MNTNTDPDLREWTADWQAGVDTPGPAPAIHDYVVQRSRFIRLWMWGELAVAVVALPVLGVIAWMTENPVERTVMLLLSVITVGAVALSRWNWRGMRDTASGTTVDFLELSLARIQRLRQAVWLGWGILVAEVALFTVWIVDRFAGRGSGLGSETFAWTWLSTVTVIAIVHLLWLSRWVDRDAARFEALRRDLQ
jgi:hypothetical protein